jgi:hypothetical protein
MNERSGEAGIGDRVYSVREAADDYFQGKVSRRQVHNLFARGELPGFRVGAKILLYGSGLDEYRRQQENQVAAPATTPEPAPRPKARRKREAGGGAGYEFFPPRPAA